MSDRGRWNERGATAVEFAIVFPLALMLVGMIMYLGFRGWAGAMINNAARDGVRYASIRTSNNVPYPSHGEVSAHVMGRLPSWLDDASVAVTENGTGAGSLVSVTVSIDDLGVLSAPASMINAPLSFFGVSEEAIAQNVSKTAMGRRE